MGTRVMNEFSEESLSFSQNYNYNFNDKNAIHGQRSRNDISMDLHSNRRSEGDMMSGYHVHDRSFDGENSSRFHPPPQGNQRQTAPFVMPVDDSDKGSTHLG